jgi:hypothetical protein
MWWKPLLESSVRAEIAHDKIAIAIDAAGRALLSPERARAFALELFGLAARISAYERVSARKPLEWHADGACRIQGDTEAIRPGDCIHLAGPDGWLRGGCVSASVTPLVAVTRGFLYLRPERQPVGEPTLYRRVCSG